MPSESVAPRGNGSRPPRVLVVDDEPQVLIALQDLLEGEFEVTATDRPEQALRVAESDPEIAVVLSDQRMPGMSGDELLAKLRQHSNATRILCTGYADLQAVVRSVNEGKIFAYVTKPWDGVDLRLKMHHAADYFRLNHELSVSEERLRLAFLASNAGLFDWNLETGETLYSAASSLDQLGKTAVDDFAALEERIHPEDRPRLREALNLHLDRRVPLRNVEVRARFSSGDYRWFEISAQAAWNAAGKAVRLVGATTDITERKEQHTRLDYLTRHDELTGLANRGHFTAQIERELAAASTRQEKLALVAMDVVRFRHVNETLGPSAGDQLLREVARRLTASAPPNAILARFHSDSFIGLLPSVQHESDVAQWVEQLASSTLAAPHAIGDTELQIAVKSGIALYPSDATSAEALIANAEAAVKKAKHAAQPYLFYAPSMNGQVAEKLRLETKLRRALANEEFLLYYQPKVELKSGLIKGVEALIRWRDPDVGLVPPGKFIPLLEETELILPVGRWVIERAAKQYREWLGQGLAAPRIAVNVSALQLAQRDFISSLDATLAAYPEAATGLDIELTESVLMDDLTGNIEKLRAVKSRGLQVSIDDFGTGYSSLGYLSRLPLDALKVDRSFINDMAEDPQQMSIVTAIISLAHAIDLKVIAEGVETPQQAQLLRLLRCDQIQGYLLARPEPAETVAKLLTGPMQIPAPQRG